MIAVFFPHETDPCSIYRDSRSSYENNDIILQFMIFFLSLSLRRSDYITVPVTVNTTAGCITPAAAAGLEPAPPVSKTEVLTVTPSRLRQW